MCNVIQVRMREYCGSLRGALRRGGQARIAKFYSLKGSLFKGFY